MTKHKVFISYRHKLDRYPNGIAGDAFYKEKLDSLFGDEYINKSVKNGEYDPDNSDEYIKRLIREDKISDSSVVIVLCSPESKGRKHIDWEIYAGLRESINGRSGLIGVLLPSHPDYGKPSYARGNLPPRLADNASGKEHYARIYHWNVFVNCYEQAIEAAFQDRLTKGELADNRRAQLEEDFT